jgi:hypothetical protein
MAQMIRKQVYIQSYQQQMLKRLAAIKQLSEAELIRQAIDRQAGGASTPFIPDEEAWKKAYAFMLALQEREPECSGPRDWRREDLYTERINRDERHSG